jgi:hypothetical protein
MHMKIKCLALVCSALVATTGITPARADTRHDPGAVAADAVLGRPLCFAATIIGSAIFVVSLPVAATSGSIHSAADALVGAPARATFVRPLGDFSYGDPAERDRMAKQEQTKKAHQKALRVAPSKSSAKVSQMNAARLQKAMAELDDLRAKYTDQHPAVQAKLSQIASLKAELRGSSTETASAQ